MADGAGGLPGGSRAAELVIEAVTGGAANLMAAPDATQIQQFLQGLDRSLAVDRLAGETTACVVIVTPGMVVGASVGDSKAWMFPAGDQNELTARQSRKPLLGSEEAEVRAFSEALQADARMLLCSDGLWKYADFREISRLARISPVEKAIEELTNLPKLRSEAYPTMWR